MGNLYFLFYTLEFTKKENQYSKNRVYRNNKEDFMCFQNKILSAFWKKQEFQNGNWILQVNIKEFFWTDFNPIVYCIIFGTPIWVLV